MVIAAKNMRRKTAAVMPQKMTFVRISGATRDAASPTMMALSPANTRSIIAMLRRAMKFCCHHSADTRFSSSASAAASIANTSCVSHSIA